MTLPPGQIEQQLQELRQKLEVKHIFDVLPPKKAAKIWQERFGDLSPKEFYTKIIGSDRTAVLSLQTWADPKRFSIMVCVDGVFLRNLKSHKDRNTLAISFQEESPPDFHSTYLTPENQGKHKIAGYMRGLFDVAQTLGAATLDISAEQIGSYAWLKYGFCPDTQQHWDELKTQIIQRLPRDKKNATLAFEGQTFTLLPGEDAAIRQVLRSNLVDLPNILPTLTDLNRPIGTRDEKPLTVGKALLFNLKWEGRLPLQEGHPSYERFKTYSERGPVQEAKL